MSCSVWMLVAISFLLTALTAKAGTWVALASNAPGNVQLMLLLTDGTVMCSDGGGGAWFKLTPSSTGAYTNGSWSTLQPMNYTRRFFSSAVLRDGRVVVAGAEYGNGTTNTEIYNPLNNSWVTIPVPAGLIATNNNPIATNNFQNTAGFSDSGSVMLPDGKVLVAPVFPVAANGTLIYNPATNGWSAGPATLGNQNEASWVKLPDDSILTVDKNSTAAERFVPSLNQWISDSNCPVNLYGVGSEVGPALLLPNGKAFFLGGNNNTALYTPSGSTAKGSWTAGPPIPNGQACPDAPAAMLVNGKVLFACSPLGTVGNTFPTNVSYYEYDPVANSYAQQNGPGGFLIRSNLTVYQTAFLCLPDGNVLYSEEGSRLYVYQPGGTPLAAGTPVVNSVAWAGGGALHLEGALFNGLSQGAVYGDDEQMDSNYPLVRFDDGFGGSFYGRTFNWSDTGVATGGKTVTTEVMPPWNRLLTPGPYSFRVIANGIGSAPVSLTAPTWVDFNYPGPFEFGSYVFPYNSLAEGLNNVPGGGTVAIKPGITPETMTIAKPMTIVAVDGEADIGQ